MSSEPEIPPAPADAAPLTRALKQSERVHAKVEQAAVDLSTVNAVLKGEIAEGVPLAKVERALNKSEGIETSVQEAAAELVAVNDALAEEIDERHHLERELAKSDAALIESRAKGRKSRHDALHDPTTGLPNFTLFNDRLVTALAQAHRHGWRLAVMFIDLDGFKLVNDTHGHDAGDELLALLARRLQSATRGGDTVSRRSGDEFLFLMVEATDDVAVAALAARLSDAISAACEIGGATLRVRASIGIALCPDDGRTPQVLLRNADTAMYAAKKEKTGPVFFGRIAAPPAADS